MTSVRICPGRKIKIGYCSVKDRVTFIPLYHAQLRATSFFSVTKSRMMQRASTQEEIGHFYQTTRRHIPKDSNHYIQSREKITSQIQSRAA